MLLAASDARYRFLVIDVGDAGRHSDSGVLSNSLFGKALETNSLSLPSPKASSRVFILFCPLCHSWRRSFSLKA